MNKPNFTKSPNIPMMRIHGYERYTPSAFDESLSILQKMNKVIYQLNNIGLISNDLINKWNELMEWIVGNGLTDIVSDEIDKRIADGKFDELIYRIVGDLTTLTTNDKASLVLAVNEINKIALENQLNIGDIDELQTDAKVNLVNAINELKQTNDINKQAVIASGESTGFGVISGFKVRQQNVLSMGVEIGDYVTPNIVHLPNGERYTIDSMALPIADSNNTMNRIDIIFVNTYGEIDYLQGVLSQNPVPPTLPDNSVLLAQILVQANDTTINNVDITDKRPIKSLNDLKTTIKDNFVLAINELFDSIVKVKNDYTLKTETGQLSNLNTSDKTNIVNAINEVISTFMDELDSIDSGLSQIIGNIALLTTQTKVDIVTAINELVTKNVEQDNDIQLAKNKLIVSTTKPTSQKTGDVWYQTSSSELPPLIN